jgi:MFS family permease
MLPRGLAVYLGVVQFFFATTWTIYVIYLPKLVAQAGIDKSWIPWILIADQAVFAVCDVLTGFWADRVRRGLARFGGWILGITAISCTAFLLVPYAAPLLGANLLLVLLFVWAVSSSALRSPPWALLSRYAATPSIPWLSTLVLSGSAIAAALAPYLGVALRDVDARIPFVLSSLTLLATVGGLVLVERRLAGASLQPAGEAEPPLDWSAPATRRLALLFFAGLLVMAGGFQVHFALNSAPGYLRFAKGEQLQYLMPVFWIGFNLLMFAAAAFVKRHGALNVMAAAGLLGAFSTVLAANAASLEMLVAAQFVAGGCWAGINVAAFTLTTALGRAQREGAMLGTLFAMFALATLGRILLVAAGISASAEFKAWAGWVPAIGWAMAALAVGAAVYAMRGSPVAQAPKAAAGT